MLPARKYPPGRRSVSRQDCKLERYWCEIIMNSYYKTPIACLLSVALACTALTGCLAKRTAKPGAQIGGAGAKLVVDAQDQSGLPQNFRIADARFIQKNREKKGRTIDIRGLSGLHISGSAQFSQNELPALKKAIGAFNIIVVDLRQESHGFVNGSAVSLTNKDNNVNKGQSDSASEKSQNRFLDSFKIGSSVRFDGLSAPMTVRSVTSEAQLVNSSGMTYLRLPVTDRERPADASVDELLKALRSIPKKSWLHFHCKAGQGRATTFMTMIDMMHNAKTVPFDDILYRQYLIGGLDLTDRTTGEDVLGRYRFLQAFYRYCRSNTDDFGTIWSVYLRTHPD
jgi:hypothetical protein